jgi:pimeloyl-ACP methyl ester carboxylesterase
VHGFLSEGREFGQAPAALSEKGWNVVVPDLRGHGRSTGPRGYASERVAVEDMRALLAYLANERLRSPYGVVGHSAGGALSARFLAIFQEFAAGVLVAPLDTLKAETSPIEFAGYRLMHQLNRFAQAAGRPSVKVPYKFASTKGLRKLYDDPQAAERASRDRFIQPKADLAWYDDMVSISGSAWARGVSKPTLVVLATHDRAVKRASSLRVFEALRGEKQLLEIPSGHSAFGDVSWHELVSAIDEWMRPRLRARSSPASAIEPADGVSRVP